MFFVFSGIFTGVKPILSSVPAVVQTDYVAAAEQGVELTVTYQDAAPSGIRTAEDKVASVGVIQVSTQSLPENAVLTITVRDQDMNTNPNMINQLLVVCFTGNTPSNFNSKKIVLSEISANTGVFTGKDAL